MKVTARTATLDEYAEVARQWGAITEEPDYGEEATDQRRKQLEWWLGTNPNGDGILAVVEEDGRYLGVAGWCPKKLIAGDKSLAVAEIGTTMTSPEARGRGVFSTLVTYLIDQAREREIIAIYGTPNEASGTIYMGRLDFVGIWPWARSVRAIAPVSRIPFDLIALARSGRGRGRIEAKFKITDLSDWNVAAAVQADEWESGAPHIDRSPEYLEWRYPADRYSTVAMVDENGSVVAWCVLGKAVRLGRPALVIADLVVSAPARRAASWFLRASIARSRSKGGRDQIAFSMSRPGSPTQRALASAGFFTRPSEMPLIAYGVTDDVDLGKLLGELAFAAGDSDTI